jgi:hypothetical protein
MFTIPNLGFSVINGFIVIIVISFLLTIITYLNNNLEDPNTKEINENEYKLSTKEYIELYISRFFHFVSSISIFIFPFFFKPNLFLYLFFIIYTSTSIILSKLVKECPFSIHEKQLLNKKYRNGETRFHEPFLILSLPSFIIYIMNFVYKINYLIILFRLIQHYYLPKSNIPIEIRM